MRDQFASTLLSLMVEDPRIILLYGDIGNRLFDPIKNSFPDRAINCGVAEANMVTVAAGFASEGLRPFVYTISSFLYLKSLEQIKLDLCYPSFPVVLVGTGGGLSYSSLGTTHHSLEDFAVLGSLPNIDTYHPADVAEMNLCLRRALGQSRPAWIRIGKKDQIAVHQSPPKTLDGQAIPPLQVFGSGDTSVAIVSSGVAVAESIEAAKCLAELGRRIDVWSVPQQKPFPVDRIEELIASYQSLIIVEEHVPSGGLGSHVDSLLPRKEGFYVTKLNSGDVFHFAVGEPVEARKAIGQAREDIVDAVMSTLSAT